MTVSGLLGGALAVLAGAILYFNASDSLPAGQQPQALPESGAAGGLMAAEPSAPADPGGGGGAPPPVLLSADAPSIPFVEAMRPPARRLRYVRVAEDLFTSKESPFWETGSAGMVVLNLFDDVSLPVRIHQSEVLGPGRYSSSGEVVGRPGSRVLFSEYDGALSISVDDLSAGRFELNALQGGVHQVYEIDPDLEGYCGGFVIPRLDADALAAYSEPSLSDLPRVEAAAGPALATVDLLIAYSNELTGTMGLSEAAIRSRIDLAVAAANSELQSSGVRARVRLTGVVEVDCAEDGSQNSALERLRRTADGFMDEVHTLRREIGADLVSLLLSRYDPESVGQGYLFAAPNKFYNQAFGFSVVNYNYLTGSNTLTHELGHNLGCTHDREHAGSPGVYPYSYGHRVNDDTGRMYRTIMSYPPGQRVSYFSSPQLVLPVPGNPVLGVSEGTAGEADNARTINQSVFEVASYRLSAAERYNAGKLVNVSTRAFVGTGDRVLIGGFVVGGDQPKQVLIRALGQSLASRGVSQALRDPRLTVYSGSQRLAANDSWELADNAAAIRETPYPPTDAREPALLITLDPGPYTAVVEGVEGSTGLGLMEVYEIGESGYRLVNLSTRGYVGSGDSVMIGGFVVNGTPGQSKRILVRALGPSLSAYGVGGALEDPSIRLFGAGGELLLENDDWDLHNQMLAIYHAGLAPGNRREPAMLLDLLPGIYTAIVRPFEQDGKAESGVALVEVYEIP